MPKKFQYINTTFVLIFIFSIFGCNNNRLDIDVSDVNVDLKILRFEEDLFEGKISDYASAQKKYGNFLNDYLFQIMGYEEPTPELAFQQLLTLRSDPTASKVYKDIKNKFGNFEEQKKELTQAYRYFKYYFPKVEIPTIITYTGYRGLFSLYFNPVGNGYIGISTDMHLGEKYAPYNFTQLEEYWRKQCLPENITCMQMMAHANDLFAHTNKQENFADEMIYYGKLLYFLDATLPSVPDYLKIGLTQTEYEWCKKEEHNIWAFIIQDKMLYETDKKRYLRLLNEGPRTILSNVSDEAPAKIGRYAGWMLIRKLMNENTDYSLESLMNESNSKKLLEMSNYKP